jgi:hypothetical protein
MIAAPATTIATRSRRIGATHDIELYRALLGLGGVFGRVTGSDFRRPERALDAP